MIAIVVGMPGSGKDVLVQAAKDKGFSRIGMGNVVRHFASQSGLSSDDMSVGGFADSQRREHGPGIWAERTMELMPQGDVIIDGSRSLDEITLFKERLGPHLTVVAVVAPPEVRYQRLRARGRQDGPQNREEFDRREEREVSWGLAEAILRADVTLVNEGTLDEFRARCRVMLREMQEPKDPGNARRLPPT